MLFVFVGVGQFLLLAPLVPLAPRAPLARMLSLESLADLRSVVLFISRFVCSLIQLMFHYDPFLMLLLALGGAVVLAVGGRQLLGVLVVGTLISYMMDFFKLKSLALTAFWGTLSGMNLLLWVSFLLLFLLLVLPPLRRLFLLLLLVFFFFFSPRSLARFLSLYILRSPFLFAWIFSFFLFLRLLCLSIDFVPERELGKNALRAVLCYVCCS